MVDGERPRPCAGHAEHDDLVARQLDSRRAACTARPELPAASNIGIADFRRSDLTQRHRHAECARSARQAHGLQRVARRNRCVSALGFSDALDREQRTFHLYEMNIRRIINAGISHGRTDTRK